MRRWQLYFGCLVFGASLALASDYVTDFSKIDPDTKAAAKISACRTNLLFECGSIRQPGHSRQKPRES